MEPLFFGGWSGVARTLLVGTLGYVTLVFILRIVGNRTLSKMNAFDAVVTIALGQTLAMLALDSAVSLTKGATAFAVLIGLQYIVTWSSARMPWMDRLVAGEPKLVAYRGKMLHDAMRRTRVTEDEIRAALRHDGYAGFDDVQAIVLETNGVFSVVGKDATGGRATLENVRGIPSG